MSVESISYILKDSGMDYFPHSVDNVYINIVLNLILFNYVLPNVIINPF